PPPRVVRACHCPRSPATRSPPQDVVPGRGRPRRLDSNRGFVSPSPGTPRVHGGPGPVSPPSIARRPSTLVSSEDHGPAHDSPTGRDREDIGARHSAHRTRPDPHAPLSVGNGEFAFTFDVTGLQTIPDFHADGIRLGTQAQWAWHSAPNPEEFRLEDVYTAYRTLDGR